MNIAFLLPSDYQIDPNFDVIERVNLENARYSILRFEEDPKFLLDNCVPMKFNPHIRRPVELFTKNYSSTILVDNMILDKRLIPFKSRLTYYINEKFSSTVLTTEVNNNLDPLQMWNDHIIDIKYEDCICYTFPEIFHELEDFVTNMKMGPIEIMSNWVTDSYPKWFVKESLRDMFDLSLISTYDRKMMEGPLTKNLYIVRQNPDEIFDDNAARKLAQEINDSLTVQVQLNIFPRNTPKYFIETRNLVKIKTGQWKPNLKQLIDPDLILRETFCADRNFESMYEFYAFMSVIQSLPTWDFIKTELKIYMQPNTICVIYKTTYLLDFLKVRALLKINPATHYPVGIKLGRHPNDNYIIFFDQLRQRDWTMTGPKITDKHVSGTQPLTIKQRNILNGL